MAETKRLNQSPVRNPVDAAVAADPLAGMDLAELGRQFRRRGLTIEEVTSAYLGRIDRLDPRLGAYEFVAAEAALGQARALDQLLTAGIDLGPLMGVPVAVKDLFAVAGMPTTAGSQVDVADLIGAEGSFVRGLKRAGCVILGKTKTVEFAFGAVGTNSVRGTPWNPWDGQAHRIPGGSSSGSAVAVAAGLCAFAIGSDTGGSIRLPAAFCGIFGLKTTVGLWATDGVFPLSPTLDSIGLLTRSAADAALAYAVLTDRAVPRATSLRGRRLGWPKDYLTSELDPAVSRCCSAALDRLRQAGAEIVEIEVPEAAERETIFPTVLPVELMSALGEQRFLAERGRMDPVIAARTARALSVPAPDYARCLRRHRELKRIAAERMEGLDAWVLASAATPPVAISEIGDVEAATRLAMRVTRTSQPGNLFGQCGISFPIHALGSPLPVGLQLLCNPHEETRAMGLALAIEQLLGTPAMPDVSWAA
jgi:aspartyl-tRNA(Asn)/glutamyl-tRNA(Gln) amidotransferase subunit A